jgi:2-iminobutanoate/2-iminopropanoate deaminase
MKKVIPTLPNEKASNQAVMTDNTLYISGQIGKDPTSGKLVSSDIESETRQVMENIKTILGDSKIDFSHIAKTSIYIRDINDLEKVNKVYSSYFVSDLPACDIVQATALQLNAHVEISIVAFVK